MSFLRPIVGSVEITPGWVVSPFDKVWLPTHGELVSKTAPIFYNTITVAAKGAGHLYGGSGNGAAISLGVCDASLGRDVTLAVIKYGPVSNANYGILLSTSRVTNGGVRLDTSQGGDPFYFTKGAVANVNSGLSYNSSADVPEFCVVSYSHTSGTVNWVLRNLITGGVQTATGTETSAFAAGDGQASIGATIGVAGLTSPVAAAWIRYTHMTMDRLLEWSSNPFFMVQQRQFFVPRASVAASPALTDNLATTASGILVPSLSLGLSNNLATSAVGTLTPVISQALTNNLATSATGSLAPSLSTALTNNLATTATGAIAASLSITLSNNLATTATGALTPAGTFSAALTNNLATTAVGALTPIVTAALTNNLASTATGTLSPGIVKALTNNLVTAATGAVAAGVSVTLTNNLASTAVGTLTPIIPNSALLTGNVITTSVGALGVKITQSLAGNFVTAQVGTFSFLTDVLSLGRTFVRLGTPDSVVRMVSPSAEVRLGEANPYSRLQ